MPAGPVRAFTGWRALARMSTYPSPSPRAQLDHVLADPHGRDKLGEVVLARTPQTAFSDHRPLLVELDRR
jgi:endonuclease/exonuclease/phosphatase family metal-dependent hydrolase